MCLLGLDYDRNRGALATGYLVANANTDVFGWFLPGGVDLNTSMYVDL